MQLTIRNLKQGDLRAIQEILPLYWPEENLRVRFMDRLTGIANQDPEIIGSGFVGLVAEENDKVVGVGAFRKAPQHMLDYATPGANTAEGYLLATNPRNSGVGEALVKKALDLMKEAGYTEVVLYNGESHKDSWGFYEHLKFENAGPMAAPNGEVGVVWKMVL